MWSRNKHEPQRKEKSGYHRGSTLRFPMELGVTSIKVWLKYILGQQWNWCRQVLDALNISKIVLCEYVKGYISV